MNKNTQIKPRIMVVALITAGLLSIPLIAMQFTTEVQWGPLDFLVMGTLVFVTGVLIDLAERKAGQHKLLAILGIVAVFMWLWAELAVGVFTNWGS